jgi:hypothetical protein
MVVTERYTLMVDLFIVMGLALATGLTLGAFIGMIEAWHYDRL